MTIEEIVHEIFQTHAHGIFFREWRGGYEIDSNMATEGFNIHIQVD
jgi:glycogen debranching enzyme